MHRRKEKKVQKSRVHQYLSNSSERRKSSRARFTIYKPSRAALFHVGWRGRTRKREREKRQRKSARRDRSRRVASKLSFVINIQRWEENPIWDSRFRASCCSLFSLDLFRLLLISSIERWLVMCVYEFWEIWMPVRSSMWS